MILWGEEEQRNEQAFHACVETSDMELVTTRKEDDPKSITINEEEAEIVRYIFRRYIEGAGGSVISQELEHLGYKTKRGSTRWAETTVIGIMKNTKAIF